MHPLTITAAWNVKLSNFESGLAEESIRIFSCGDTIQSAIEIAEAYLRDHKKKGNFFIEAIQLIRLDKQAVPCVIGKAS